MTDVSDLLRNKAALDAQMQAQKMAAVAQVTSLMGQLGLTWEDFGVAPVGSVVKRPIKYRDDRGNTWSGVGQRPRWLAAAVLAGATVEQFHVKED